MFRAQQNAFDDVVGMYSSCDGWVRIRKTDGELL